ncbi:MAG: hypothetical protein Alis3KO_28340 [Aliiglaciecola sp.]|uniref:hypothetical protein n=1 Tax=Aliiglaciecola sp. M165 TaxID=2593649 RepID=UPI00117C2FFC|nr:hypothetical protein [Aliiglaciecola sp. M165]TRY33726.1 hypothetical protein FM019_00235 [Aliiglaciecola sp. M165]
MNMAKYLFIALTINLSAVTASMAEDRATKSELRAMAVEACHIAAEEKYGDGSVIDADESAKVQRDASRVKWHRSLKGMVVNMKIKPDSKRKASYTCLVKTDRTITFFKA